MATRRVAYSHNTWYHFWGPLQNDKTSTGARFEKWNDDYSVADGVDVVINATSIGLYPDANARLALNLNSLSTDMVVADVISNPP